MIIHLEDTSDPRVSDYLSLTDTQLRKVKEPAEGLYIAESPKVLRRALAAGHQPRSFFVSEKRLPEVLDLIEARPEVPAYVGTGAMLEEITGINLHRGAMAAMHRPAPEHVSTLLARIGGASKHDGGTGGPGATAGPGGGRGQRSRIAILEGLSDHANVGSAFRNAAAMGVDAVLVTPDCADPLYRRSVRVSMGTVFQVPWTKLGSWPADIELLKDAGYVIAGMTLGVGAITLDELVAEDHGKLALVLGTEGYGITAETDRLLDRRVTIPMMGGVDSLNVAAASAIAFYAAR